MNTNSSSLNINRLTENFDRLIRKYTNASNGYYLLRIGASVRWEEFYDFVSNNTKDSKIPDYNKDEIILIIKSLILGKIFDYQDFKLPSEISKNNIFLRFLKLDNPEKIPTIKNISNIHHFLIDNGLFDLILEKFYKQLIEMNFEISESSESEDKNESNDDINDDERGKIKIEVDKDDVKLIEEDKLYVQMYDLFFKTIDTLEKDGDQTLKENEIKTNQLMKKLRYVDEIIKEIKNKLKKENKKPDKDSSQEYKDENKENDTVTEDNDKGEEKTESHIIEPIELHPLSKKEGLFNDENLTEDYELGYRFYQLGLKMGFFNVKLDNNNESSRISTAEFFPNTFWGSVKQRSRWIAGICLQNWKAHKWKGNLTMKYFLFRDRKPMFSLFSAFLSNVIFFYLLYLFIFSFLYGENSVYLVSHSSVLFYIMAANVIFMVSRAAHRFIFTYNWYGFKYAFFSFFRLIVDTAVNFFAVLRSISVYKRIKKKVVWDSTTHY